MALDPLVRLNPLAVERFHFVGRYWSPESGRLRLVYRLEPGPELVETLHFPPAMLSASPPEPAFSALLDAVHWIAGVSYWKTACAPAMVFHEHSPDGWQSAFLRRLYLHGLAEFAHENQLDLASRLNFPAAPAALKIPAPMLDLPARALVPLGGGKDSLVVLERLRARNIAVQPVAVGQAPLIAEVAAASGLPLLRVARYLDPQLQMLNRAGAWNGHIPITAVNSAILSLLALLAGYRWLVFANERSADSATRSSGDGAGVNHQYSKSLAFERDWRAYLQRYAGGPDYFSLLRSELEVAICRDFARLSRYHGVFSSCNRHFHLDGARLSGRWCGVCPKCHFVFLALAPFMPAAELSAIFGANLLDDEQQQPAYARLLGLHGERPFECIGEVAECRAALAALAQREEWRNCAVVRALAPQLPADTPALQTLLEPRGEHCIPAAFYP